MISIRCVRYWVSLFSVFLLFYITPAGAQQSEKQQRIEDSLYFYGLKDSVNRYWYQDPEKVQSFSLEMMAFAKDKSNKSWTAQAFSNFGHAFQHKGGELNLKRSIIEFEKAIALYKELNIPRSLGNCYNGIAITYKELGHFPKALEYSLKSLEILKSVKDTSAYFYTQLGISYTTLANRYKNLELYDKALKMHDSALHYFNTSGFLYGVYGTYLNQSTIL